MAMRQCLSRIHALRDKAVSDIDEREIFTLKEHITGIRKSLDELEKMVDKQISEGTIK